MESPRQVSRIPEESLLENVAEKDARAAGYGLRRGALSPLETLAQSVSTIAPTTTPAATIPLVCALAGNGTWLVYLLATAGVLLVAFCISRLARYSASPGSLYTYASMILPPWLGAVAAWSLLLAYIATGASVAGGFYYYANILLRDVSGRVISTVLLTLIVTAISMWIAARDVEISTRLMLWFEAVSLAVILTSIPAAPAPGVSSAAWATIGLLAALAVVLLLVTLGYRSRARRPPPREIEPVSGSTPSVPASSEEAAPPAPWVEQ